MGIFDKFKVKPLQRLTSSLWNSLMDALNQIHTAVVSDVTPAEDNKYSLGSGTARWSTVYAYSGDFRTSLTVDGKTVLKDGDPVTVSDLGTAARDKIRDAVDASSRLSSIESSTSHLPTISSRVESIGSKIASFRQDPAGNLGSTLADIEPSAVDKLRSAVDASSRLSSIELYTSNLSSLVALFTSVHISSSISANQNTAGFSVTLDKSSRPFVNVFYSVGGPATIFIEISEDGNSWRLVETIETAGAGSGFRAYVGIVYKYIRVRTPTTGIEATFEMVAAR